MASGVAGRVAIGGMPASAVAGSRRQPSASRNAAHSARYSGQRARRLSWSPWSTTTPDAVAGRLARGGKHAAILCLGAVIKGETTHDEHINRAVSLSLAELGAATGVPLLFGLLTCNTLEQAIARSGGAAGTRGKDQPGSRIGNKGAECAEAALEMVDLLNKIG